MGKNAYEDWALSLSLLWVQVFNPWVHVFHPWVRVFNLHMPSTR